MEWAACLCVTGGETRAETGTAGAHRAAHAERSRPGGGRGAQAPTDQLGEPGRVINLSESQRFLPCGIVVNNETSMIH